MSREGFWLRLLNSYLTGAAECPGACTEIPLKSQVEELAEAFVGARSLGQIKRMGLRLGARRGWNKQHLRLDEPVPLGRGFEQGGARASSTHQAASADPRRELAPEGLRMAGPFNSRPLPHTFPRC